MDTWAPVVRWAHEGVGGWTNDAGTLALNTSGGPLTGQSNLRATGTSTDTAAHEVAGNQWTDAYGEALLFPSNFSGNTNRKIGVWLRVASSSNCYTIVADGGVGGNGNMTISKVVAGTPTALGTTTFSIGDVTSSVAVRGEAQGDWLRAYWRGQLVLALQDTTFTGPGFVSLFMRANTTAADVQAMRWEAGPLRPTLAAPYTQVGAPLPRRRLR